MSWPTPGPGQRLAHLAKIVEAIGEDWVIFFESGGCERRGLVRNGESGGCERRLIQHIVLRYCVFILSEVSSSVSISWSLDVATQHLVI